MAKKSTINYLFVVLGLNLPTTGAVWPITGFKDAEFCLFF